MSLTKFQNIYTIELHRECDLLYLQLLTFSLRCLYVFKQILTNIFAYLNNSNKRKYFLKRESKAFMGELN